ncbi:MAG: family 16 glycosylhydrolase [Lachnospiraceae bacterium]|nr:family 16 glycosylhydrolase [Lachnospiraceae bacterium]
MKKLLMRITGWLLTIAMLLSSPIPAMATESVSEGDAASEIIISTADSAFETTGTWKSSGSVTGYNDIATMYSTEKGASFKFNLGEMTAGTYEVFYYVIYKDNNNTTMPIVVNHNGEATTVNVPLLDSSITGWYSLGKMNFTGDGTESITYTYPESDSKAARVSAIKLVPAEAGTEEPSEPEQDTNAEIVVSTADSTFETTGTWKSSGSVTGYNDIATMYSTEKGASFKFNLGEMTAGTYEVFYYVIYKNNNNTTMPIVVNHNGEATTVNAPLLDSSITGWYSLGKMAFTGDGTETITYTYPESDSKAARVSAIKLVPVEEVVITTADSAFETTGTWKSSGSVTGYNDIATMYSTEKGASFKFNLGEMTAGTYEVFYYVIYKNNNNTTMPMVVNHNGKTTTVNVPLLDSNITGWYSLGKMAFTGDGTETITYTYPESDSKAARVSAIKLVSAAEGTEEPSEPEQDTIQYIDVEPYPGFSFVGDWGKSTKLTGPMTKLPYSLWINHEKINASQAPLNIPENNYCTYRPDLQVTAGVQISVYLLYWHENQTKDVIYEVHHNGQVDTFHIDMTTLTKDEWRDLGVFDFSGSPETNFVRIVCTSDEVSGGKTNFRASTVRFDVLNDAASGGIWQSVYVSPSPTAEIPNIAELDQFEDIADDAANKYDIEYMYNEGYVTGTSETIFSPDTLIQKNDFTAYLSKVLGLTDGDAAAVKTLLEGVDENETLTKEEIAKILHNAVRYLNKNVQWIHSLTPDYKALEDANTISDWAVNAMDAMYRCGIVTATESKLMPQKEITRAEAVIMLKQFAQQFVKAGPTNDDGGDWVLTFNEEFQGTELDPNVWTAKDENPSSILSSRHPENVEVHDGAVHLVTKNESKAEGKEWTTGNILANKGAFVQEFGYWEARYKYTKSSGINNSFWMVSDGEHDNQWYELDVCEGHYANKINTNLHEYATQNGNGKTTHSERYTTAYDLAADYHTYAVEWTPEYMKFYFDGQLIHTKNNPLESGRMSYARLSSAVLSWAGAIDPSADGTAQIVDYVRVYQRNDDVAGHTQATEHALDGLTACVLEKVEATPANCTEYGVNKHWKCTICNKIFADESGTTEIDVTEIINNSQPPVADAHAEEVILAKAATCTETGLTEGKKCSICDETLVAQTETAALGHTEIIRGKFDATCVANGYTGDVVCSVCGTVLNSGTDVGATGSHLYLDGKCTMCGEDDSAYNSSENVEMGTTDAMKAALVDEATIITNAIDSVTGELSEAIKVDEETKKKIEAAVAEAINNPAELIKIMVEQVATPIEESAVSETIITAIESFLEGVKQEIAANSTEDVEKYDIIQYLDLSVWVKAHNVNRNTKTTLGELKETTQEMEFTVTIPNEYLKPGYEVFVLRYHDGQVDKIELSQVEGNKFAFSTDKFSTYALSYVSVHVHTEEIIPGKAPTSTQTGLTEGKKCSACGETLVAQTEIPATGSDDDDDDEPVYVEQNNTSQNSGGDNSHIMTVSNPNTGDTTSGWWFVALVASVVALIVLSLKKRSLTH